MGCRCPAVMAWGLISFPMDMKHDFAPDPEVSARCADRRVWPPEAFLLIAIFVAVWVIFAVNLVGVD